MSDSKPQRVEPRQQVQPEAEARSADLVMLDQQLALGAYLQALLQPPVAEVATPVVETVEPPTVEPPPAPVAPPAVKVDVAAPPLHEPPAPVLSKPAPEPAVATAASSPYPDWAQGSFQCLLFRVGGISLALPLVKLNGVLPWDDEAVTAMPNHRPWFLGLREYLGHKVKLIDVANVVLPDDRYAALAPADANRLGKVILIDDGRWGLAVDAVDVVVTLSVDAVKWRTQAGSRPWLAGTVIKHMCALIDTDAFADMLGSEGPKRD